MSFVFPKALIFDWDNTLVDSWPTIALAINHMRAAFNQPPWTIDEIKINCTRAARDSFPDWYGDEWKKAYDIYYEQFVKLREERGIKALEGAEALLRWLKEVSIPIFVVSNKRGDLLRSEIDKLKWQELFVAVVGAQDASKDKPAREHVDHALKKSDLSGDPSIWFVGDSDTDVLCARNANCTPIFIGSEQEAKRLAVKLFFSDCQALQTLLYNHHKKTDVT